MEKKKPSTEKKDNAPVTNEQAVDLAVKYLDYGRRTEKQIADYLKRKGAGIAAAEHALSKLLEYKYIDDFEYCRAYVEANIGKAGAHKIRYSLIQKGAMAAAIENALTCVPDETQEAAALIVAEKYVRNKEMTAELTRKAARFLYGRGFSWEVIKRVTARFSSDAENVDFEE